MWIADAGEPTGYLAVAHNVALYHGESLQHAQGRLSVHSDKLQYQCTQGTFALSISWITELALRPGTLTRSPKVVLLVEGKDGVECAVCLEKTATLTGRCTHCGSPLMWTCDVCEHEDNLGARCVLCGNANQRDEDQRDASSCIQVFMLSFRGDPPEPIYASLSTLLQQQREARTVARGRSFGVTGLLEREEEAALNRDLAVAALSGNIGDLVRESRGLLALASELAKLEDDSAKGALQDLGLGNGIRWTDDSDLRLALESFIGRQFTGCQALLLSDLYCLFNRACALGFFVTIPRFLNCLQVLQGRVNVRTVNSIKFVQSGDTPTDDQVIDRLDREHGTSAGDLSAECHLPVLIAQCILNDGLQRGRVVVDDHQGDLRYYHNTMMGVVGMVGVVATGARNGRKAG